MKSLTMKKQLIRDCGMVLVLAGLFYSTPVAWGQFADQILGRASACVTHKYGKKGNVKDGYTIKGEASVPACENDDFGAATSESNATVGPPEAGTKVTTSLAHVDDTASSEVISADSAILYPPNGFQGKRVNVTLTGEYEFDLQGVAGADTGSYILQVIIDDGDACFCLSSDENGHSHSKFKLPFKVKRASDGFLFTVEELVGLEAEAGPDSAVTGSVNVSDLEIELPEGWTSKWVSQQNGYGHQVEQSQ
jgi:hypothetical protein